MNVYKLLFVSWLSLLVPLPVHAGNEFIAVAYHDVVDHRYELNNDAVTLDNLIDHFEWIKVSGYHPISIDDLQAAQAGTRPLPPKPILLCWDDGYKSFYTHVFPLLKAYRYPAVLALVGSWMEPGPDKMVQYGSKQVSRKKFMTWKQVQDTMASGLVEIASHSNELHTALLDNAYGDMLPAVIAHKYDPTTGRHETDLEFKERIHKDLQASSDLLLQHTGLRPRVLVWPFGHYNTAAQEIASEVGMTITLTLNNIVGDIRQLQTSGRIYPTLNPDLKTFRSYLEPRIQPDIKHYFLTDSHDLLEPVQGKELHFSKFLDRVKDLNPNMVVVNPLIEDLGVTKALFVNNRFPVAQNRLTRIVWHTSKRTETDVFLWLSAPLFTPIADETTTTVNGFFADMGKSAPGEGFIVDDPELANSLFHTVPWETYLQQEVRFWNPDIRRKARQTLAQSSTQSHPAKVFNALESFQYWQPFQEVGLVLSMDNFSSFHQDQFNLLLSFFDFLVIDSRQYAAAFLKDNLTSQLEALDNAGYLRKCTFLFSIEESAHNLDRQLHLLPTLNIINWGYQFDRFLDDNPPAASIRHRFSKTSFPYPLRR